MSQDNKEISKKEKKIIYILSSMLKHFVQRENVREELNI